MMKMPGFSHKGELPKLSTTETKIRDHLKQHVQKLAGDIGERNMWHAENLQQAAQYIENTLQQLGYQVLTQEYDLHGQKAHNIEAILPSSTGSTKKDEIIIVGAHYDSVYGSPGADDNATGVAAVLEIARLLAKQKLQRSVHFVAFVNEEPPFFMTQRMGSYQYATRAKKRNENIVAMFSIESIGYYSDKKNSQFYPFPFGYFYPNQGNFIGFVGNLASFSLVRNAIAIFRATTAFPSEGIAAPGWIVGISWSDQWSFWKKGYPAVMITDSALFRNPNYHTHTDLPDTIDYNRTARVVLGLTKMVARLAGR